MRPSASRRQASAKTSGNSSSWYMVTPEAGKAAPPLAARFLADWFEGDASSGGLRQRLGLSGLLGLLGVVLTGGREQPLGVIQCCLVQRIQRLGRRACLRHAVAAREVAFLAEADDVAAKGAALADLADRDAADDGAARVLLVGADLHLAAISTERDHRAELQRAVALAAAGFVDGMGHGCFLVDGAQLDPMGRANAPRVGRRRTWPGSRRSPARE
mmetsp:Transcript_53293/g.125143  ORF Transcript_53293/g.125143 Transcript_53293/m.125143 type:complete len:216 (-) Transcript_53293:6908-7555(-)